MMAHGEHLDFYNLLTDWKLSHLFVYLRDQNITLEELLFLSENDINKLFQNLPIGEQALFEYKLKVWKSEENHGPNLYSYCQANENQIGFNNKEFSDIDIKIEDTNELESVCGTSLNSITVDQNKANHGISVKLMNFLKNKNVTIKKVIPGTKQIKKFEMQNLNETEIFNEANEFVEHKSNIIRTNANWNDKSVQETEQRSNLISTNVIVKQENKTQKPTLTTLQATETPAIKSNILKEKYVDHIQNTKIPKNENIYRSEYDDHLLQNKKRKIETDPEISIKINNMNTREQTPTKTQTTLLSSGKSITNHDDSDKIQIPKRESLLKPRNVYKNPKIPEPHITTNVVEKNVFEKDQETCLTSINYTTNKPKSIKTEITLPIKIEKTEPANIQISPVKTEHFTEDPSPVRKFNRTDALVALLTTLKNTIAWNTVLKYYEENQQLQVYHRDLIIQEIAEYVQLNKCNCSMANCKKLQKQICKVFPSIHLNNLAKELYTEIRSFKTNKKYAKNTSTRATKKQTNDAATDTIKSLRNNPITTDEFEVYWKLTWNERCKLINNASSVTEVFKEWPEYKKSLGYLLISMDFSMKFPNAKELENKWLQNQAKIHKLFKIHTFNDSISKFLLKYNDCNEDSKIFATFWYLHYIFSPIKSIESMECQKFTITQSQESFAIIGKTSLELGDKLSLFIKRNSSIRPCLLVLGDVFYVKSIGLYFNGITYPISKTLLAVDILYKLIFVFNLEFPKESHRFYNFLQKCFYEMNDNSNKNEFMEKGTFNENIVIKKFCSLKEPQVK